MMLPDWTEQLLAQTVNVGGIEVMDPVDHESEAACLRKKSSSSLANASGWRYIKYEAAMCLHCIAQYSTAS